MVAVVGMVDSIDHQVSAFRVVRLTNASRLLLMLICNQCFLSLLSVTLKNLLDLSPARFYISFLMGAFKLLIGTVFRRPCRKLDLTMCVPALRKKSERRMSERGKSDVKNSESTKSPNSNIPTTKCTQLQKVRP